MVQLTNVNFKKQKLRMTQEKEKKILEELEDLYWEKGEYALRPSFILRILREVRQETLEEILEMIKYIAEKALEYPVGVINYDDGYDKALSDLRKKIEELKDK